jgi:hypothetical protein
MRKCVLRRLKTLPGITKSWCRSMARVTNCVAVPKGTLGKT